MSFERLEYITAGKKIIRATRPDGSVRIIDAADPDMLALAKAGDLGEVEPFKAPPKPTKAQQLAEERAAMRCSAAQLGLALIEADSIKDAEAAFDTSAKAGMIWAKASHIQRRGPILDALKTIMSDTRIDDLFRAAMATEV
ncbi:MAG: hypothetical protein ACPG61_07085 [Paracoccaceae bacterium]